MDRATRKANLKKLQLPGTTGHHKQRKPRQTDKSTATANIAISKYFLTPKKPNNNLQELPNNVDAATFERHAQTKELRSPDRNTNIATRSRAKRTKLDAFIFKDPNNMPSNTQKIKRPTNDEDLVLPERKIKKAPKSSQIKVIPPSKSSKARKQTAIKTAFLRNEELFAEIAAQHCAADQFDGDDVQLALAISKSEADNKGTKISSYGNIKDDENYVGNNGDAVETIREKLKKYGFRTAEKKDYNTFAAAFLPKSNNRRQKSKWANKFTALTLRRSEIQLKKLQENIEKLLNSQFCIKPIAEKEQDPPQYKLLSSLLKKSDLQGNRLILNSAANINQPNELFFVTELFEINEVPAGHLLKDWRVIQGRDLTPNPKDKPNMERAEIMKNIYQDLETYFSVCKRLDWTWPTKFGDDPAGVSNNKSQSNVSTAKQKLVQEVINEEYVGQIELSANIPGKEEECVDEIMEENNTPSTITTSSDCDKEILQLLPTSKSLDVMHVSSCSIYTQATINTSQKNRSNSPDLFADSDVELEEIKATANVNGNRVSERLPNDLKTDITTYEIFSSDEVKKTSLMELNKCDDGQDLMLKKSLEWKDSDAVDLTQQYLQCNKKTMDYLNQGKPIIEVDLFADSPLQDENSNSSDVNSNAQYIKNIQTEKEFKFTLSLETVDKEQHIGKKKAEESHKLKEDDDKVIAMDQTNLSVLNFEGEQQLEESFHKNTATTEFDIAAYNLSGNDAMFRDLCNKYLNQEATKQSTANGQKNTNLNTYPLPTIETLKPAAQCDHFADISMDFDITNDNHLSRKRKSLSFTANTVPIQLDLEASKIKFSKTTSFNNLQSNISIDLTQNESEDKSYDEVPAIDDDDDCFVLSDDEINYSIWQANNTLNLKTNEQNAHPDSSNTSWSSNTSSGDEDYKIFHRENIVEFPFRKENEKEFSHLDLEEKEKSLIKITLGPEEAVGDFEVLTSKYVTSNSAGQEETKFDRSEFGILEEYSEPIDYTPTLYTPTKVLTEASFLSSPTEATAPMKRYGLRHKSSKNFRNLVMDVQTKSPPADCFQFEDFDDFDIVMSKRTKSPKKPLGIDQLLKAEISFKESHQQSPIALQKLPSETQVVEYNNKTYTVRYTDSPKPDYTKYSDAELLKQLYNFGIKPLKRKQAVKILEYIYNQTHPILMEDVVDDNGLENKYEEDVIVLDDFELPGTSKEALKSNTSLPECNKINLSSSNHSEKVMTPHLPAFTSTPLELRDSCGRKMLRYSSDLKAELQDEIYILQTNVTKKTPRPLLPFHIAWYNLVCSNIKLHETILMYEPIDLQEIYLFLKSIGYRYDPKDLKTFFDRRCIIFRYDLAGAVGGGNNKLKNSNRHVRKSKKKTNQQNLKAH